jgi:pyruvate/oxaloacetate carboxyltransferase
MIKAINENYKEYLLNDEEILFIAMFDNLGLDFIKKRKTSPFI